MQDSSTALASETTSGDTPPNPMALSAEERASIRRDIRAGNFDDLRGGANNKLAYITERFCRHDDSIESLEQVVHDLWYIYYQCGSNISHESAEQHKWALHVLRTAGLGPIKRPAQADNHSFEVAKFPTGVLWEDLSFFVEDMTDYWVNDFATMEASQRVNFSYFLARLASTGIVSDRLSQIALVILRDTLETERPLGSLKKSGGANPDATMHGLPIAALLPAACAWFKEAGLKLLQLSDISWNDCSEIVGQGGAAFAKSGLGQKSSAGFSPSRWLYWLKRLDEVNREATHAGEECLAEHALDALETMLSEVEERNCQVLTEFEAAPSDLIRDKYRFSTAKFLGWDDIRNAGKRST
ncbi:hypothetical protein BBP40_012265 [Aspergillus hancockii]|nr:hypothetical protein BBP40_012265 [Aspergillus hancockii]